SIRKEAEASLRRLGIERLDLYQFHWPDETGTTVEHSWEAMVRLVEQGKVRAAGVSNFDLGLLARCEEIRHADSLQPPFSLIRRDVAEREIPWCAEHRTGVLAYSPMQSGILTDGFTVERVTQLAPDDWRRRAREFQQPNLGKNLALRDALRPIARRHGTTASAVAIAWTLASPRMSGGLFLDGLARETGRRLTPEDEKRIQQVHAASFKRQVSQVRPLPGACDLLSYLSQARVPWAIATSGRLESARPLLEMLGVRSDVPVVTRDQVEHAKPDPDLFLAAAARLNVPVGDAVVVGDSVWDLLAARRARALGV